MGGQAIVTVHFDAMVTFAGLFLRVGMNDHERKILKVM
jgi:hypothetical protein